MKKKMKNGYDRTLLYHDVNNAVDEQGKRENLQEPHLHHAIPPTHGCMSQRQMFRLVTDMQGTSICWLQMQKNHEKSTAKDAFFYLSGTLCCKRLFFLPTTSGKDMPGLWFHVLIPYTHTYIYT